MKKGRKKERKKEMKPIVAIFLLVCHPLEKKVWKIKK